MAISIRWLKLAEPKPREARPRKHWFWAPINPALKALLDRRDDRLLRDVGLTREDILGEAGYWWYERSRRRGSQNP
jgi:hypothetical protein